MKIVAVVCNILFWAFLSLVLVTDGVPRGADIGMAVGTFLMPIFNVVILLVLSSPGRKMLVSALILNILWLGIAGWRIVSEYPSHPAEEGLLEFAAMLALTPLVSAVAIYLRISCK